MKSREKKGRASRGPGGDNVKKGKGVFVEYPKEFNWPTKPETLKKPNGKTKTGKKKKKKRRREFTNRTGGTGRGQRGQGRHKKSLLPTSVNQRTQAKKVETIRAKGA